MKPRWIAFALLVCIAHSGHGAADARDGTPLRSLRGSLVDAASGTPAAGVTVVVLRNPWDLEKSVVTGDDGSFVFDVITSRDPLLRYVDAHGVAVKLVDADTGKPVEITVDLPSTDLGAIRVIFPATAQRYAGICGDEQDLQLPLVPLAFKLGETWTYEEAVTATVMSRVPRLRGAVICIESSKEVDGVYGRSAPGAGGLTVGTGPTAFRHRWQVRLYHAAGEPPMHDILTAYPPSSIPDPGRRSRSVEAPEPIDRLVHWLASEPKLIRD